MRIVPDRAIESVKPLVKGFECHLSLVAFSMSVSLSLVV